MTGYKKYLWPHFRYILVKKIAHGLPVLMSYQNYCDFTLFNQYFFVIHYFSKRALYSFENLSTCILHSLSN